jgi:hypothetical protein
VSGSVSATLLTNGGFESGSFSDWTEFGEVPQEVSSLGFVVEEGTYGVWMKAWNANKDGGIYQDASASEGSIYALDAAIKVPTNFVNSGSVLEVSLLFLNGSDAELSRVSNRWDSVNGSTDGAYESMATLQAMAPLGTVTVRTKLHWITDDLIEATSDSSPMADSFVLTESTFGLLNGGFEEDTGGTPVGWTAFGDENMISFTAPFARTEGTNGLWMQGWVEDRDGGVYQDVAAASGFNYALNGNMKVEASFQSTSGTVSVAVQCLDASDAVLDQQLHSWSFGAYPPTVDFFTIEPLEINWAPAATTKVRTRFYLVSQSAGAEGSAMADDLSLTMEFVPRGMVFFVR